VLLEHNESAALRHRPKQLRGQRTVEHILRSAEAVFAESGFETATTNAIAARAGVSIGSLYQFFSSKDAILEAMASRYLEQTHLVLFKTLESEEQFELDYLLTTLLDTLIKLQEQRPYFLQCLRQSSLSPVTKAVREFSGATSAQVLKLLERGLSDQNPKLMALRARVCVETISALLPLAVHSKGRERAQAVDEIKLMLQRYLEPSLRVKGML
jgi:AcrR family transcriptional regulator